MMSKTILDVLTLGDLMVDFTPRRNFTKREFAL